MPLSRRRLLAAAAVLGAVGACGRAQPGDGDPPREMRMPEEGARHARTFLAWPARGGPWQDWLDDVRADIAALASTVAAFEPAILLANPEDVRGARAACGSGVDVLPIPVDDLWIRDTGPTFVHTAGGLAGVDTRFNGWGGKQAHARDRLVARRLLRRLGIERVRAPLVTEGGSLEVNGHGVLLANESSIVNANRNPGRSRDELTAGLKRVLGLRRVLWLPGVRGADITDGHIDGLVRFTAPGAVLLSRPAAGATRAEVRQFEHARTVLADDNGFAVTELPEPDRAAIGERGSEFFGSYINYYVVNGGVLAPKFGDRDADDHAAEILRSRYPGREIVQLPIDTLAEGGGGIHCATQQQPADDRQQP